MHYTSLRLTNGKSYEDVYLVLTTLKTPDMKMVKEKVKQYLAKKYKKGEHTNAKQLEGYIKTLGYSAHLADGETLWI